MCLLPSYDNVNNGCFILLIVKVKQVSLVSVKDQNKKQQTSFFIVCKCSRMSFISFSTSDTRMFKSLYCPQDFYD